ncbi:MAG: UDP-2,4-diacetamido-2,4,6-trideoxy-beta-L-altropyranose hydrolase [Burkholderiaceae bacterium]|nr:UDP-2,4-diacetamido-2,4,6-trideoxy-beta-L-altropyranose hydrolase [Burkholderiaceae bacterium]
MSLVALRADASARIGSGHVRRCLALAAALRARGAQCVLVARDLGLDLAPLLAGSGVEWLRLPAPAPGFQPQPGAPAHAAWAGVAAAQDAAETAAALCAGGQAVQALVVDHYAFDAGWHRALREMLGASSPALRIAAIDDLADRDLAVDLLIDHNHAADHRAKYGAHLAADVPLLGGPRHALLAPVYAEAPRHVPQATVASVGISFGGVDADGHSLVALAALQAAGFAGEVEIVITSACPHRQAILAAAAARPGTRVLCDLPHLAGFYARHGLQIGAGGGATWERCCMAAPTLAVVIADNQRAVLDPLADLGVLLTAAAPTVDALLPPLRELLDHAGLRRALSRQAQTLVDGQGAARVAEQLLRL